ncbi:hypothetical protein C2E23DRAFT_737332 [Lenzites betulinus]|nr:hypothetical protein C2E23DRAFT_737332 [Lenzites betulinus]
MPFSESNSRLMLIDDRDTAVLYDGSWERLAAFGDSLSLSNGPNASVSMEFDGTRIIVVALAAPAETIASFGPKVQLSIDASVVQTVVPEPIANWTFYPIFDVQGLADGIHTINVTVLETSDDYPFLLDYFMFQPSQKYWDLAFAPSMTSTMAMTSNGDGDGGGDGVAPLKKPGAGAIIGGVLAGSAALALVVTLFFWWRRRRQHSYSSLESNMKQLKPSKIITPFLSTEPTSVPYAGLKRPYSDHPDPSSAPSSSTSLGLFPSHSNASTHSLAPSDRSSAGATAACSPGSQPAQTDGPLLVVPGPSRAGYQVREAPRQHSVRGRVELADSALPGPRKGRRPSVAGVVQAVTRWTGITNRREEVTPTEAPPTYSER